MLNSHSGIDTAAVSWTLTNWMPGPMKLPTHLDMNDTPLGVIDLDECHIELEIPFDLDKPSNPNELFVGPALSEEDLVDLDFYVHLPELDYIFDERNSCLAMAADAGPSPIPDSKASIDTTKNGAVSHGGVTPASKASYMDLVNVPNPTAWGGPPLAISSLKDAYDFIVHFLMACGLNALTRGGLFLRLAMALSIAGYRYVCDDKMWVKWSDSAGRYIDTEEPRIVGFIAEWAISEPLAAEMKWLRHNIPNKDNPFIIENISAMYTGANRILHGDLAWRNSSVKQMTGHPLLTVLSSHFDTDPEILNAPNGYLDLRTLIFTTHLERSGRLLRQCVSCEYNPSATCPRWLQFLNEAIPGDDKRPEQDQIIPYLQYIAGTAILGYTPPHRSGFWIHGKSTTGKSIFTNVLRNILGRYATLLPTSLLMKSGHESRMSSSLADIEKMRLVCVNEIPDGQLDDSIFKQGMCIKMIASKSIPTGKTP